MGTIRNDDVALDFGDAPDPAGSTAGQYPTLAVNNGARHSATGVQLGALRDVDTDGQPSAAADLDDFLGTGGDSAATPRRGMTDTS